MSIYSGNAHEEANAQQQTKTKASVSNAFCFVQPTSQDCTRHCQQQLVVDNLRMRGRRVAFLRHSKDYKMMGCYYMQ
jgi:hypothetical protein